MTSRPINLAIEVHLELPEPCPPGLRDVLAGDEAEYYLYDQLCSWLWRYMPDTVTGFDLMVDVTVKE